MLTPFPGPTQTRGLELVLTSISPDVHPPADGKAGPADTPVQAQPPLAEPPTDNSGGLGAAGLQEGDLY